MSDYQECQIFTFQAFAFCCLQMHALWLPQLISHMWSHIMMPIGICQVVVRRTYN